MQIKHSLTKVAFVGLLATVVAVLIVKGFVKEIREKK